MSFTRDSKKTITTIVNGNIVTKTVDNRSLQAMQNDTATNNDVDLDGKPIDIDQAKQVANKIATALRAMENDRHNRRKALGSATRPVSTHNSAAMSLQQERDDAAILAEQLQAYNEPPIDNKKEGAVNSVKDEKTAAAFVRTSKKQTPLPMLFKNILDVEFDKLVKKLCQAAVLRRVYASASLQPTEIMPVCSSSRIR